MKKKDNDWKDRLGMVYSTNPDYNFETVDDDEIETIEPQKQKLRVSIEKKNRGGKTATIIKGFIGSEDDLKSLCKNIKVKCGTGGSAKDGEIIIQGEIKDKVIDILKKEGYVNTK